MSITGVFGCFGDISKIWECPDLIKVKMEGTNEYHWILIISSGSQYEGFTGMQYFIGDFDGDRFIVDKPPNNPRWLDYGKDYYAAISYNNLPEGHAPVMIGWINNWRYANTIPTSPWRGMMSIPRELSLEKRNGEIVLIQKPTQSFTSYCKESESIDFTSHIIENEDHLLDKVEAGSFRLKIEF